MARHRESLQDAPEPAVHEGFFSRHFKWVVGLCVAFDLLIIGAYSFSFGQRARFLDEYEYFALGYNVAHGHGYSVMPPTPTAGRSPGWPLLLTPFMHLQPQDLRFIAPTLLALSTLFGARIAWRLGGKRAAMLAAIGVCCYPLAVFTATTFYPETLSTTLLLLVVMLTLEVRVWRDRPEGRPPTWLLLVFGLSLGAMVETQPSLIVVGLMFAVYALWPWRAQVVRVGGLFLIGMLLPIAAWTARNEVTMHAFIPFNTTSGLNLYLGNNPTAGMDTGINAKDPATEAALNASPRKKDELYANSFYQRAAVKWIEHNPVKACVLYVKKFINYFNPSNALANKNQQSASRTLLAYASLVPIVLLTLLGLRVGRIRRFVLLVLGAFVVHGLVNAVFFTRVRFRLPLDEVVMVTAAIVLAGILTRLGERRRASTA